MDREAFFKMIRTYSAISDEAERAWASLLTDHFQPSDVASCTTLDQLYIGQRTFSPSLCNSIIWDPVVVRGARR